MKEKGKSFLSEWSVELTGPMGTALQKTIENRLKKINYTELVDPFRYRSEADDLWRCEFWGKIVRSVIRAWQGTHDPELYEIIQNTVEDLLSTQTSDGCISSYPESKQLSGWDLWGRKYVLTGLVRYCETFEDHDRALDASCRMVEHLAKQLGKFKLTDCGQHFGMAAASILSPLVRLYRLSGNQAALALADSIVENGACHLHNIYKAAACGVPPAELSNGKSYEMTGCYESLWEYAKVKPDPSYREILLRYYEMVRDKEIFITGTGGLKDGNGEFWFSGAERQVWQKGMGKLGETCVTVAWLHYCRSILEMTDDSRVADEMERSFYNGLLGAMHPDGHGWIHRNPTPLSAPSSKKITGEQIPGYGGHDCCLAQGPEGISMISEYSFAAVPGGIRVNGYENSCLRFQTPSGNSARLVLTGDYPAEGKIRISLELESAEQFVLELRVPGWSEQTTLCINGAEEYLSAGSYAVLERVWEPGTVLELSLDMQIRQVSVPGYPEYTAFCRGPLVLAQDSRYTEVGVPAAGPFEWKRCQTDAIYSCESGGMVLCDYASAGNGFSPENTLQVWLNV